MKRKTLFLGLLLALIVLILASAMAAEPDDLIAPYETGEREFRKLEIGDKIVYFHQRMIDDAIVEKDFIVYQFDRETQQLLDKKVHWRSDLPDHIAPRITRDQANAMADGEVQLSELYIISPESDAFPLDQTPNNPCWVVRTVRDGNILVTIIDAVTGKFLGLGVPPPQVTGFSLTGPTSLNPCSGGWTAWYESGRDCFEAMGYTTEAVRWPTEDKVRGHIQSDETAVFYELAHGDSTSFASGCCEGTFYEFTTAAEVQDWISDYTKMPFAFIGSCGGMCNTGPGTLSHAFRQGSMQDTVTVGYCGMGAAHCSTCWYSYSLDWQETLFEYMATGSTIKDAYDQTMADYPACAPPEGTCMRFAGDEDFQVVPKIERGHRIWYVGGDVVSSGDGRTWATAFKTIQEAVDAASKGHEIWVKQGAYLPASEILIDEEEISDIAIYGGFDGTEDQRDQRDWQANITTISGSDTIGCITVLGARVTIDGFYFANAIGSAMGVGDTPSCTVANCFFFDNSGDYGGGIHTEDAVLNLSNVTFLENEANFYGGAIYSFFTMLTVADCTFGGNAAGKGGAVYFSHGGPIVSNCTFSGNLAGLAGGGIYNDNAWPGITDCAFSANEAEEGAGIYNYESEAVITNCRISGNIGGDDGGGGGGMYNKYSDPLVTNCVFLRNQAHDSGSGAGMYNNYSEPAVTNCTFFENWADNYGGGIYNFHSYPTITNCILWGDTADISGPEIYNDSSSPIISYSDVQGGYTGTGNINAKPLFENTVKGDLHLESGSPCIDAAMSDGAPEFDCEGKGRYDDPDTPNSGAGTFPYYDIGAYEYYLVCEGDFDSDGDVDGSDLAVFAADFGRTNCANEPLCEGDFDSDGDVDGSDLAIFAADFGRTDCPVEK